MEVKGKAKLAKTTTQPTDEIGHRNASVVGRLVQSQRSFATTAGMCAHCAGDADDSTQSLRFSTSNGSQDRPVPLPTRECLTVEQGAMGNEARGKGAGAEAKGKGADHYHKIEQELAATREELREPKKKDKAANQSSQEPEEGAGVADERLAALPEAIKMYKATMPHKKEAIQEMEEEYQALRDKKALERPLPTRLQTVTKTAQSRAKL